jgi:AcrR family transcriptional regulator
MSPRAQDWLIGDRHAHAAERIYAAATEMVARDGLDTLDALDIDDLAARVHCSRATVYRHAGGKSKIRDAVVARLAARIVEEVRARVQDLAGPERVLTAVTVAVQRIRTDPMADLVIGAVRNADGLAGLAKSGVPAAFAAQLSGLAEDDPAAAAWIVRLVLSLLCWPGPDEAAEREMLERFVLPGLR